MPGSVGVGDNTIIITSEDVGCFQMGVVLEKLAGEVAPVGFVESSLKSSVGILKIRSLPQQPLGNQLAVRLRHKADTDRFGTPSAPPYKNTGPQSKLIQACPLKARGGLSLSSRYYK